MSPASDITVPLARVAPAPSDHAGLTLTELRSAPELFAEVYERNYDRVASYVQRRVGDRQATEDIVSDVFLSALRGFRSARRERAPVRFWLLRIATNRVNRWMRKERGRPREVEASDATGPIANDDGDGSAARDELRAALRTLSTDRQAALTLHYIEGLSIAEVSTVLECAEGTVKSRLARGREELAARLAEWRSRR